jgi:prolyl oligopeptidase
MMSGASLILASVFLLVGAAIAGDEAKISSVPSVSGGPPLAEKHPLEETLHGVKIVDNYRWLEDGSSAETQKWVEQEMGYTRRVLDPLPGRDAVNKRLTQLLTIGSLTPPQLAGKYYFYTRREGMQNQPVLYVREGVDGKDRVLVDANALAADGTIALDWYQPSENGRLGDEHSPYY